MERRGTLEAHETKSLRRARRTTACWKDPKPVIAWNASVDLSKLQHNLGSLPKLPTVLNYGKCLKPYGDWKYGLGYIP